MKLPNGTGTVYKLSGNRRRPWIARKTLGWDNNGKQMYYTIGYFKTQPEALSALMEYNKNPIAERGDITLGELYEEWSKVRYPKLSDKTIESYSIAWNHLSKLGDKQFKLLKASHLQDIIGNMEAKGLGYSSCHKVKVLAGLLYKYAMADDIVDKNYATFIVLPERDTKEHAIFTDIEIRLLESLAKTDEWAKSILILIYTGMRIGELLAHTKFTVDIDKMLFVGGNKTEAGKKKIVPIHSKIQGYVRYWYKQEGSYFITKDGQRVKTKHYRDHLFYPTLEKAGINIYTEAGTKRLTPHSARHTFASMLNRAGVNIKYQQDLIGHADYSTTANIYTHPEINELKNAIEMI